MSNFPIAQGPKPPLQMPPLPPVPGQMPPLPPTPTQKPLLNTPSTANPGAFKVTKPTNVPPSNLQDTNIQQLDQQITGTSSEKILDQSKKVPQPSLFAQHRILKPQTTQLNQTTNQANTNALQTQTTPTTQTTQTTQTATFSNLSLQSLDLDSAALRAAHSEINQVVKKGYGSSREDIIKDTFRNEMAQNLQLLKKANTGVFKLEKTKDDKTQSALDQARLGIYQLVHSYGKDDQVSTLLRLTTVNERKELLVNLLCESQGKPLCQFDDLSKPNQKLVNNMLTGLNLGLKGNPVNLKDFPAQEPGLKHPPTQLTQAVHAFNQAFQTELGNMNSDHLTQLKLMNDNQILAFFQPKFGSSVVLNSLLLNNVRSYAPPVPARTVDSFVKPLDQQDLLGPGVKQGLQNLAQSPQSNPERTQLKQDLQTHLQSLDPQHNTLWQLSTLSTADLKQHLSQIAPIHDQDANWLVDEIRAMLPTRASQTMTNLDGHQVPDKLEIEGKTYLPTAFLAKAGYGSVFKYTDSQDPTQHVAVKVLQGFQDEAKSKEIHDEASAELTLHRELQGPKGNASVIGLKGAVHGSNDTLCMVQEFAPGGDLYALSTQLDQVKIPLESRQLLGLAVLKQALEGVAYMHDDRQMLHSDLKSGNLMMGQDGQVKLIDFGTATLGTSRNIDGTVVDNPIYRAPEQGTPSGTNIATTKSDVWSIGTLAHELLIGPLSEHKMYSSSFLSDIGNNLTEFTMNKDSRFMNDSPKHPPSTDQQPIHDLINQILMPLPEQRSTARELLKNPLFQDPRLTSNDMSEILKTLALPQTKGTDEQDTANKRFDPIRNSLNKLAA